MNSFVFVHSICFTSVRWQWVHSINFTAFCHLILLPSLVLDWYFQVKVKEVLLYYFLSCRDEAWTPRMLDRYQTSKILNRWRHNQKSSHELQRRCRTRCGSQRPPCHLPPDAPLELIVAPAYLLSLRERESSKHSYSYCFQGVINNNSSES